MVEEISLTHVKLKPWYSRRPTKRFPDVPMRDVSVLYPATPMLPEVSSLKKLMSVVPAVAPRKIGNLLWLHAKGAVLAVSI